MNNLEQLNLDNINIKDGALLKINGRLIIGNTASIVIELDGGFVSLKIYDTDFLDNILYNVPCYVGGKYLYDDTVQIIALIGKVGNETGIKVVNSCVLNREDYQFLYN